MSVMQTLASTENPLFSHAGGREQRPLDLVKEDLREGRDGRGPIGEIVSRVERELIAQLLAACNGVQLKAAARLGIKRNTLRKKLQEQGLEETAATGKNTDDACPFGLITTGSIQ